MRLKACLDGSGESGIAPCREALVETLTPAHRGVVLDLLAQRLSSVGKWDEALEVNREAVKVNPSNLEAQLRLGDTLLFALGRAEEALGPLKEASALKADDPRAPASLGAALNAVGSFRESIGAFEEAVRRDPSYLDTHPASRAVRDASSREERWPFPRPSPRPAG